MLVSDRYSDYSNEYDIRPRTNPRQSTQKKMSGASASSNAKVSGKTKSAGKNKMSSDKRADDELSAKERKQQQIKKARRIKRLKIAAVIVAVSTVLSVICISCLNDILAINRDSENFIEVTISEDSDGNINTKSVISALDKAKLIKNKYFCILAAKLLGYTDQNYRSGMYTFTPSMGLENMLDNIKSKNSSTAKTVTLTFPEGYTMNQILQKLEDEKVCPKEKLIAAMNENDYSEDYSFVKLMDRPASRYYKFEGYFYPDTYEFYLNESPDSIIRKFLDNFKGRWTDKFDTMAAEQKLSIDDIITIASIVEKEGTSEDKKQIASVLINRINTGMQLQCDSTRDYEKNISSDVNVAYASFQGLYDTYTCSALPVGPICNPGMDSIEAVLYHPDSDYYYFYHDSDNIIHLAKTLSGHNENMVNYP